MSAIEPKAGKRPIQLRWDNGKVCVNPDDESRLTRGSPWAACAGQSALTAEDCLEQFQSQFLSPLYGWCEEHQDRVLACFVPLDSTQLSAFVVRRNPTYDFSLSDSLSDLELELFNQNWPADIVQIPAGSPEELQTFFNAAESIQVYDHAQDSHNVFDRRLVGDSLAPPFSRFARLEHQAD